MMMMMMMMMMKQRKKGKIIYSEIFNLESYSYYQMGLRFSTLQMHKIRDDGKE